MTVTCFDGTTSSHEFKNVKIDASGYFAKKKSDDDYVTGEVATKNKINVHLPVRCGTSSGVTLVAKR